MDNQGAGTDAINKISREKYWEEADQAEQIDRLRDEVVNLCRIITEQGDLIMKLAKHQHAQDGELLVSITSDFVENRPIGYFAHDNGIPHRLSKEHERR